MTPHSTNRTANRLPSNRRTGTSIAIAATPTFDPTSIDIPSPLSIVRKLVKNVRTRWTTMRQTMEPASLCYSRPTLKWHADPKSPEMVEKIAEWNACSDEVLDALVLSSAEADVVEAPHAPTVARAADRMVA